MKGKVNILGVTYTIVRATEGTDNLLEDMDGYCDVTIKKIVVKRFIRDLQSMEKLELIEKRVLRHEIIHAFLYESGIAVNSGAVSHWASNEEMIDWIALQFSKIHEAFEQAGAID